MDGTSDYRTHVFLCFENFIAYRILVHIEQVSEVMKYWLRQTDGYITLRAIQVGSLNYAMSMLVAVAKWLSLEITNQNLELFPFL